MSRLPDTTFKRAAAVLLGLTACGTVAAGPIINGDFSDPIVLAGFLPTGDIISEPTGEFAQLETDGSFARTLEQTFSIPAIHSLFSFDFAFTTEGTPPIAGFPDSFAVSILTVAGDFLDILVVDALGVVTDPSDGIELITGALPIQVGLDPSVGIPGFIALGGTTFSGRITLPFENSVLGQNATVFVDLFDEADGFATRAAVDNFLIVQQSVPEPATLLLMLLGLLGLGATAHRRTRFSINKYRIELGPVCTRARASAVH